MILSIHANKGRPLSCPPTHLSFSLGLITAHHSEPFKVFPFALDELQIVANPPYGSFVRSPSGLRVRRWLAHECFILVYITVAQLFCSTHWLYDYKILSAPLAPLLHRVRLSVSPTVRSPSISICVRLAFHLISWKYHHAIKAYHHHAAAHHTLILLFIWTRNGMTSNISVAKAVTAVHKG